MKVFSFFAFLIFTGSQQAADVAHKGPDPLESKQIDLMVERHNFWRKKVGSQPLKWSKELATYAQEWADNLAARECKMEHRKAGKYGENIFWSRGLTNDADFIVDSWASEIKYYRVKQNDCKGGVCGHYTQLVWHNSTSVGCGMAKCGDQEIWVCNYNPPGNYVGERPYKVK